MRHRFVGLLATLLCCSCCCFAQKKSKEERPDQRSGYDKSARATVVHDTRSSTSRPTTPLRRSPIVTPRPRTRRRSSATDPGSRSSPTPTVPTRAIQTRVPEFGTDDVPRPGLRLDQGQAASSPVSTAGRGRHPLRLRRPELEDDRQPVRTLPKNAATEARHALSSRVFQYFPRFSPRSRGCMAFRRHPLAA